MSTKKGPQALLDFTVEKVVDEIKKLLRDAGQFACAKIDHVVAELKAKGCKVPPMRGWSCDQKIAFVAALGPEGVACIVAGALTGELANNTVHTFNRYSKDAEKSAQHIANHAANQVSQAANNVSHKLGF